MSKRKAVDERRGLTAEPPAGAESLASGGRSDSEEHDSDGGGGGGVAPRALAADDSSDDEHPDYLTGGTLKSAGPARGCAFMAEHMSC